MMIIAAAATLALASAGLTSHAGTFTGAAAPPSAKFGIGVYTDTAGSPPADAQLAAAATLVGPGGWVTLYGCR